MQSPFALVLDDDAAVRERAREALSGSGFEVLGVATPHDALEMLRSHPSALVIAFVGEVASPVQRTALETLFRLHQRQGMDTGIRRIQGRSEASQALRDRIEDLAGSRGPVLFAGETGSGRRYAARCLHELTNRSEPFSVADPADPAALEAALAAEHGTVFVASIETLAWPVQEAIGAALAAKTPGPRFVASIGIDPRVAAEDGRVSPSLLAAFDGSVARVPALRERRSDIATLAKSIVEDVRRLNRLSPITVDPLALGMLERYVWPGNVDQLRNAIESAMILASDGTIRVKDLPGFVTAGDGDDTGPAARRFRDAKRAVVEAFERAYLGDLLRRHTGNVTGAAETSGMLRSALQRLLRKHALHSADFRLRTPGPSGT